MRFINLWTLSGKVKQIQPDQNVIAEGPGAAKPCDTPGKQQSSRKETTTRPGPETQW